MKIFGVRIAEALPSVPWKSLQWSYEEVRAEVDALCGDARELMQRAEIEACECRKRWPECNWIGTEHILLAVTTGVNEAGTELLRDKLAEAGLTLEDIRAKVLNVIFGS